MLLDPFCFCEAQGRLRVYVIVDYDHGHDIGQAMELTDVLRDCVGGVLDAACVAGSDESVAALDMSRATTWVTADCSHPPEGAVCPDRLPRRVLTSRVYRMLRRLFTGARSG